METLKESLKTLPHAPGVYMYFDASGNIIYVGKAIDLSRRVKQYFQDSGQVSVKTTRLVSDISRIETIQTTGEFEALLLEARLIRTHLPKYNVIARDDKSPLYVVLTLSEELPRVLTVRRGEADLLQKTKGNVSYGPFPSAHAVRTILKQIRQAIPYCTQKQRTGRPCFYTQLGLCTPCPSQIQTFTDETRDNAVRQYRSNIRRLQSLFEGKISPIRDAYERRMREYANAREFETAQAYKTRIDALYALSRHRYDPAVFMDIGAETLYLDELTKLRDILRTYYPDLTHLHRIECYDISQLHGTAMVGSMVVLTGGMPDKSQYRRFRIRGTTSTSDTAGMEEVLRRRLKHPEWPMPQLIVVDGGKPQARTAEKVISSHNAPIPYAGLAKRFEELILPDGDRFRTVRLPLDGQAIKVLQRIRDEAHRFAVTYHRKLRETV